ncbi:MAG: tetratricopeptide repeat protein [Deltaproteobacteria bacterium]|nr:tetratricopeptide repeat protein [Deltaproteobacteria bacterium]MCB9489536.1 tetratricopeptide repeat protein [Deltaproteobacteria bacterium]
MPHYNPDRLPGRLPPVQTAIMVVCLVFFAGAAYAPSFGNAFTYDARAVLLENKVVENPANLRLLFSPDYYLAFDENTYRPIVTLTYFFDAIVFGKSSAGAATTSLAIHLLAAFGLFLAARKRLGTVGGAMASLIFAVHPAASEALYCVGHREAALGGMFVFWTIALDDHAREPIRGATLARYLSLVVFVLGLFAVESVILAPAYLAAERILLGSKTENTRAAVVRLAPYFVIAAAFWILRDRYFVGSRGEVPWLGGSWGYAAVHGVSYFLSYLRLLILPMRLRADYGSQGWGAASPEFALGLVAIAVVLALVASRKTPGVMRVGLAWIGLSLLPFLHVLMPFWTTMAERYLYVGTGAFAMMLAAGIIEVRLWRPVAASYLLLAVLLTFALLTHSRGYDWRTDLNLWEDAADKDPESSVAWLNLAQARRDAGDDAGEEKALRRLRRLDPYRAKPAVRLADFLERRGNVKEARSLLQEAAQADPATYPARFFTDVPMDRALAWEALGLFELRQGNAERAYGLFHRLDKSGYDPVAATRDLAQAALVLRRIPDAVGQARKCIELSPGEAVCHQVIGVVAMRAQRFEQAAEAFAECARFATDAAMADGCRGNERLARQRMEAAAP